MVSSLVDTSVVAASASVVISVVESINMSSKKNPRQTTTTSAGNGLSCYPELTLFTLGYTPEGAI